MASHCDEEGEKERERELFYTIDFPVWRHVYEEGGAGQIDAVLRSPLGCESTIFMLFDTCSTKSHLLSSVDALQWRAAASFVGDELRHSEVGAGY